MLRNPRLIKATSTFVRYSSQDGNKRFMQTIPAGSKRSPAASFGSLNYQISPSMKAPPTTTSSGSSRWAKHSLSFPIHESAPQPEEPIFIKSPLPVVRRSRRTRYKVAENKRENAAPETETAPVQAAAETKAAPKIEPAQEPVPAKEEVSAAPAVEEPKTEVMAQLEIPKTEAPAKKPRRKLRPRMALITLSPNAIKHLQALLDQPEPQLIRIGVRNRGCSGLTYHLEYVTEGGKFDELVEQDGVKVLIDLKALFLIVGSEMDWIDDKLSSRFIFKNPNSKGTCGCGESFMV